jgi:gamma-glutamyl-gamma-aminobutyrate hydrolase PuuD
MAQTASKAPIAITAATEAEALPYAEAIERSGGAPWLILPSHELATKDILSLVGGLLLCGGADIHPRWYGESVAPSADLELAPDRDDVELPLLKAALERDIPVLGICRGMQALNVVMGGKLVQEIAGHGSLGKDGQEASSYHRIFISPGSKLASIVGAGGFVRVNSRHHQGIWEAQKSPLLLASAYSLEDGVIEALESPAHRWVIGVQFHPELSKEVPPHFERLFQSFAERSAEHADGVK